ncbi:MAG: SDR family NAD(P)-dependent oxidoreductase [Cyanobacteria bacterium P01_H01_bin.74]
MSKTILITGSTDGIGLATAKQLLSMGHRVLLHGRNSQKLNRVKNDFPQSIEQGLLESYEADLSNMSDVLALTKSIITKYQSLDILINNAGVLKTSSPTTSDGFDVRFVVNTIAPYLLTKKLLPLLRPSGRVVNLSSAAQAPVNIDALSGKLSELSAMDAYAQSKLAITMWTNHLASENKGKGPMMISVNPGSMLGSKMVQQGFGVSGKDINIGANILVKVAIEDGFSEASGQYFDNDLGQFSSPHSDAGDQQKCKTVVSAIEKTLEILVSN